MISSRARKSLLPLLYWLGVALTGIETVALLLFPFARKANEEMLRDVTPIFPVLARLTVSGWLPIGFALAAAVGLTLGLRRPSGALRWIAGALAAATFGCATCSLSLSFELDTGSTSALDVAGRAVAARGQH